MRPPHPPAGHPAAYPPPDVPQYPAFPSSLNSVDPPPPPPPPPPAVYHHASHNTAPNYAAPSVPPGHHIGPPQQNHIQHNQPHIQHNQPNQIHRNQPSHIQHNSPNHIQQPAPSHIQQHHPPNYTQHNQPSYIEHNASQPDPSLSPDDRLNETEPAAKPKPKHFYPHIEYTPEAFPPPPPIPPNTAPSGHFDMLPPPHSTHRSWETLYEYAQEHASIHGYAMAIHTTEKNRCRVKLTCVCYGKAKNTRRLTAETRVRRNRASQKTGCRMNLDCRKHADGNWTLRVRNPAHNHAGRASDEWSLQRKRTWGHEGRKIGTGGVTAQLERAEKENNTNSNESVNQGQADQAAELSALSSRPGKLSPKEGSLVWKIIEQEMLTKLGPGNGRDRGCGRTVRILEERLPGINIFKRDVYNIRAQIRRMRKQAGQEIGEGLDDSGEEEEEAEGSNANSDQNYAQIDPGLIAQCNSALQQMPHPDEAELERLREEVKELRNTVDQHKKDLEAKNNENAGLRMQVELANMAMYNVRGAGM